MPVQKAMPVSVWPGEPRELGPTHFFILIIAQASYLEYEGGRRGGGDGLLRPGPGAGGNTQPRYGGHVSRSPGGGHQDMSPDQQPGVARAARITSQPAIKDKVRFVHGVHINIYVAMQITQGRIIVMNFDFKTWILHKICVEINSSQFYHDFISMNKIR